MDSVGVARRRHRLKSLEKSKLNACNPYPIFGFSCQCVSPNYIFLILDCKTFFGQAIQQNLGVRIHNSEVKRALCLALRQKHFTSLTCNAL